jgi:O-antigen ligase
MLKIRTSIKKFNPELLFVVYFWGFLLLRPVLQKFAAKSTLILFVFVLLLSGFFLIGMILKKDAKIGKSVLLLIVLLLLFLLDATLRNNSYSYKYIYRFIYCGFIPVLFLSKIRDSNALLKYYTWFSLIAFLIFAADPIGGYKVFSNYMDYGINFATPAFFGIFLGCHYFKMRWMLVFEVLCFICILVFANRGALITAIFFIAAYFVFMSPKRKKILIYWFLPINVILVVFFINIQTILKFAYEIFVNELGLKSYSLNKITGFIQTHNSTQLFSGRLEIWAKAGDMLKENLIFGHGMGSFQQRFGFYTHNIFLDIMIFFGLAGVLFFGILIVVSLYNIWNSKESVKILGFLFFLLWFPKLLFSMYFIEDVGFWCFIGFASMSIYLNNYDMEGKPNKIFTS